MSEYLIKADVIERLSEGIAKANITKQNLDKIIKNGELTEFKSSVNTQLADMEQQKLDKTGIVSMVNMGQDVKEAMTGGSVAVVGKNAILNENIVSKQISQDKTDFVKVSSNLLNIKKITQGFYISQVNGNLIANAGFVATDYIEVEEGSYYKNDTNTWAYYDENKNFISGGNASNVVNIPSNVKFIRYSIPIEKLNNKQMFSKGNSKPSFVSYYNEFVEKNPLELLMNENIDNSYVECQFGSDGNISKITHKDRITNVLLREDVFSYPSEDITQEVRTLISGDKKTFVYNIRYLTTEVI